MDKEVKKQDIDANTYHFFFNHGIYDELVNFKDLITETKDFLKGKTFTKEEKNDERFGKETQYKGIFPMILWKSLFLSSYFLLENSLNQICKNLKKSNSYRLSINEISGNGIFRSSLYLKKVCDVVKSFQSNKWAEITDFNKIRNVLVHSDGVFPKSNVDMIKICQKYGQIALTEYEEDNLNIEFDSEFCKYSLGIIEELFQEIHAEIKIVKNSL